VTKLNFPPTLLVLGLFLFQVVCELIAGCERVRNLHMKVTESYNDRYYVNLLRHCVEYWFDRAATDCAQRKVQRVRKTDDNVYMTVLHCGH